MIWNYILCVLLLGVGVYSCSSTEELSSDVSIHLVVDEKGTDTVFKKQIGTDNSYSIIEIPFINDANIVNVDVREDEYIGGIFNLHIVTSREGQQKLYNAWRMRSQFRLGVVIEDSLVVVARLIDQPIDSSLVFTELDPEQIAFLHSRGLVEETSAND